MLTDSVGNPLSVGEQGFQRPVSVSLTQSWGFSILTHPLYGRVHRLGQKTIWGSLIIVS